VRRGSSDEIVGFRLGVLDMIGDGAVNRRNIWRFGRARGGLKAPNPETVATNRLYCF